MFTITILASDVRVGDRIFTDGGVRTVTDIFTNHIGTTLLSNEDGLFLAVAEDRMITVDRPLTVGDAVRHTALNGLTGVVTQVFEDRGGLFATIEWAPFMHFPATSTTAILESTDTVIAPL